MGLYKQRGSSVWWYRFKCRGRPYRFTTGRHDRSEAAAEAQRLRLAIEASAPITAESESGLAVLAQLDVERAIAAGASTLQTKTLERDRWAPLVMYFGDVPAKEVNNFDAIQGYVLWCRTERKVRGQTIKRELAALKRGLKIAKRKGWIRSVLDEWPVVKNDPPKESQRGKLHSPEVLRAVVAALPLDVKQGVAFALLTGLRYAELRRVKAEYIEPAPVGGPTRALLKMPAGKTKTRKERIVGLTDTALAILEARASPTAADVPAKTKRKGRKPRDYDPEILFPRVNYRNVIVKACTEAGYPRVVTLRDLRHTFLTLGLLETGDLRATMAAGGHTKESTALGYQHSTIERTAGVSLGAERLLLGPEKVAGSIARGHTAEVDATSPQQTFSLSEGLVAGWTGLEPAASGVTVGSFGVLQDKLVQSTPLSDHEKTTDIEIWEHSDGGRVSEPPAGAWPLLPPLTARLVEVVEGWVTVECLSCTRRVEIYDHGGELRCPVCELPLSREGLTYVA